MPFLDARMTSPFLTPKKLNPFLRPRMAFVWHFFKIQLLISLFESFKLGQAFFRTVHRKKVFLYFMRYLYALNNLRLNTIYKLQAISRNLFSASTKTETNHPMCDRSTEPKKTNNSFGCIIALERLSSSRECAWIQGHEHMTRRKNETVLEKWHFSVFSSYLVKKLDPKLTFIRSKNVMRPAFLSAKMNWKSLKPNMIKSFLHPWM